jgi:hypothetical protein
MLVSVAFLGNLGGNPQGFFFFQVSAGSARMVGSQRFEPLFHGRRAGNHGQHRFRQTERSFWTAPDGSIFLLHGSDARVLALLVIQRREDHVTPAP